MSAPIASTTADETGTACRRVLTDLMEIGMVLARRVQDEADVPASEAVATFERVSRSVRRTVRMLRWLDEPVAVRRTGVTNGPVLNRVEARKRVLRAVEDRIDAAADPDDAAALHGELLDRLDTAEFENEIGGRPVVEIIGEICRDLGLERSPELYPTVRRGLDDLAALQARAEAAPGAIRAVAAPDLRLAQGVQMAPGGSAGGSAHGDLAHVSDEALDAMLGLRRRRSDHP